MLGLCSLTASHPVVPGICTSSGGSNSNLVRHEELCGDLRNCRLRLDATESCHVAHLSQKRKKCKGIHTYSALMSLPTEQNVYEVLFKHGVVVLQSLCALITTKESSDDHEVSLKVI